MINDEYQNNQFVVQFMTWAPIERGRQDGFSHRPLKNKIYKNALKNFILNFFFFWSIIGTYYFEHLFAPAAHGE